MPYFRYQGRGKGGQVATGKIQAGSKREAILKLRDNHIAVIDLHQIPETLLTKEIMIGKPVKMADFVIFLRQFATLLKAGVSVVDSTRILREQTDSKGLRNVLADIEEELRSGNPLSSACAEHPKIFPPLFINMMKAGEAGGTMDETLERMAVHYEKVQLTRQKVFTALMYPFAVGIIAIVAVIFLLTMVVPTFVSIFDDAGADLPWITSFVLDASQFMSNYWWLVILFVVLVPISFSLLKRNKSSRYYLDYGILKVPIVGKLVLKAAHARMTRTLSSLFASSVPILQALSIVERVINNKVITKVIRQSRESLEHGKSLTEPMRKHWAFPPLITQMIAIGEETGALDEMLDKVADFYEQEVDTAADRLKALIEPVMIVVLAVIVGTIVAAIMIPMFDLFNQIETY